MCVTELSVSPYIAAYLFNWSGAKTQIRGQLNSKSEKAGFTKSNSKQKITSC